MATQLRRYEIAAGELDRFVEWFPAIVPVREKFGFTVDFAYADPETNQFLWAVSYPGSNADFEAAVETYNDSPERAAVFANYDSPVVTAHISMVDQVI